MGICSRSPLVCCSTDRCVDYSLCCQSLLTRSCSALDKDGNHVNLRDFHASEKEAEAEADATSIEK